MKISYAITVCNELEEVKRLLDLLLEHKREQDEIVVLVDTTKPNDELISTLRHYESHNMDHMIVWPGEFDGHFAEWKNKLTELCSGDYVFQIDADEYPHPSFIESLPAIVETNPDVDVYLVPRVNTVEGLTQEHIQKWGWRVDNNGWVNWPDWQHRVYRNDGNIKWQNKVHEILVNHKQFTYLPVSEEYALFHPKTISRQEKQNDYYNKL
ncbi:Glycosyltransferase 2-like [uncultured Caudovirales phage]|uniref:Glycosyltransferase 2-like n=1 Tax=uncultured Caudovirales phage TaxID=2100421 RepID=A0A6J5M9I9_9CAUD|nr:Glycosyltransferase 2-like [uncultured Caudovirales phage]